YATDFTLVTLPSEGGPTNMISVNAGRASFGTSTAESVKEAYDGTGEFQGKAQTRIRHVASFGFSLMFIYTHPASDIQSITDLKGEKLYTVVGRVQRFLASRFSTSMALPTTLSQPEEILTRLAKLSRERKSTPFLALRDCLCRPIARW